MTSFEVTPGDLQGLAGQLSGLLGELQQASSAIRSGAGGAAQNGQLEGAINGFVGDWSRGLEALQTKLDEVAQRLEAGGGAYDSTESNLAGDLGLG